MLAAVLATLAAAISSPSSLAAASSGPVASDLPWHPAVTHSGGGLLAWYKPQQGLGYDQVLRLGWNFVENGVPDQAGTGLKAYLVNSVFDGSTAQGAYWQSNPSMLFGSFVDSVLTWYPYSSDGTAIATVRGMLDYLLAHGLTPTSWSWSGVPFPTGCVDQPDHGRCLSDTPPTYYGGIEPDKVGRSGSATPSCTRRPETGRISGRRSAAPTHSVGGGGFALRIHHVSSGDVVVAG